MVRAGVGDYSGAKLVEQRGIDFAPAEDFIHSRKTAGAGARHLSRAARSQADRARERLEAVERSAVFRPLAGGVSSHRVAMRVYRRQGD